MRIVERHLLRGSIAPQIPKSLPEVASGLPDVSKDWRICHTYTVQASAVVEKLKIAAIKWDPLGPVQVAPVGFE
jgi:hypothetical protein